MTANEKKVMDVWASEKVKAYGISTVAFILWHDDENAVERTEYLVKMLSNEELLALYKEDTYAAASPAVAGDIIKVMKNEILSRMN